MSVRSFVSQASLLAALGAALLAPSADALQSLQEFLDAAKNQNPDALEAAANAEAQDATASVQFGRALPGVQVKGTYTHNQYNAQIPYTFPATASMASYTANILIQPYDQFDAYLTLNVPLIDLGQFKRIAAARRGAEQTRKQIEAVRLQVAGTVAQNYYQLVANLALVSASKRQLEVAQQSLALTTDKFNLGSSPELDVDRAKSQVEQQVQQLAAANLQESVAQRALYSASLLDPVIDSSSDFVSDLHEEAGLEEFLKSLESLPQVQAAALGTAQADATTDAAKLALVPTLAASATEHFSNAPGFIGTDSSYQILVALNWTFDFTSMPAIHVASAQADAARARELRARLAAGDAIITDWNTVKAAIAQSQSARAQVNASKRAADLALDQYKNGAATQLDLLQAQRDAFSAEVSRIQADANLANARAQLRLSVGQTLGESASSATTNAPTEKGVQPK